MRGQTFGFGEVDGRRAKARKGIGVATQEGRTLHEVLHPKPGRIAGGTRGGKNVVGTAQIIADRFGRVAAKENRTGVGDLAR